MCNKVHLQTMDPCPHSILSPSLPLSTSLSLPLPLYPPRFFLSSTRSLWFVSLGANNSENDDLRRQTAKLLEVQAENETLRQRLKLVEDDSDSRFDQVKVDSMRLAEVWESEKRRLQEEVSRQRELVEVERENAVRVREQMSTLAEEIRGDAARDSWQSEALQTEELLRLKSILAAAESEREAALSEATWLRRELRTVKDNLIVVQDKIHAKESALMGELSLRSREARFISKYDI